MNDFMFHNPVTIAFGKNSLGQLSEFVKEYKRVVIIYGGGSVKASGLYDKVKSLLGGKLAGEFGGIEPNPHHNTCMQAVKVVREHNADLLLAVGGGSVADATKYIACVAKSKFSDDQAWEHQKVRGGYEEALPIGTIMTLAATGSEMNPTFVISNGDLKCPNRVVVAFPKFSILNPEFLYTLPKRQLQNGVVDSIVHIFEVYMTKNVDTFVQDRQAEALLITLFELGEKVVALADKQNKTEEDYNTMASFMWASTNALNGLLALGVVGDFSTHFVGHQLTALYNIDHAQTLAIVLFGVWEQAYDTKKYMLATFAERVLGIKTGSQDDKAKTTIKEVEAYFKKLGVGTRLSDYGVTASDTPAVVAKYFDGKPAFGDAGFTHKDVESIIKSRM